MTDHDDLSKQWQALPNGITVVRILGSPVLILLAPMASAMTSHFDFVRLASMISVNTWGPGATL